MLNYQLEGNVAILEMNDGKVNALGHDMLDALQEGLDKAEREATAIIFRGRQGLFSAGFDLKEMQKSPESAQTLVTKGARFMLRVFSFPKPVLAACEGHAIAAGALLLLASDTRVGAQAEYNVGLNETAIGVILPPFGMEMAKCRIPKRYQTAAILQSQMYNAEEAVTMGYLDKLVDGSEVLDVTLKHANQLSELPGGSYGPMKLALRHEFIERVKGSLAES